MPQVTLTFMKINPTKLTFALVIGFLTSQALSQEFTIGEFVETEAGPRSSLVLSGDTLLVPYFPATTDYLGRSGVLSVVNRTDLSGSVNIVAYDDSGFRVGPIEMNLHGNQSIYIDSAELENGDPEKGISTGIGLPFVGDWRLTMTSDLDIHVVSYIRSSDGLMSPIHDSVPIQVGKYAQIGFLNASDNMEADSLLRLVNPGDQSSAVTIYAFDEDGNAGGKVQLTLQQQTAVTLDTATLEEGDAELLGKFGASSGRWRLELTADKPILAMNLLASPIGSIANLSTRPLEQHKMDAAPPKLEITAQDRFDIQWNHNVGATDELRQAFDILYSVGDGALWNEACVTHVFSDRGERSLRVWIQTRTALPSGEIIQARYRQRGGPFCVSGLSHDWSGIGEISVPGSGDPGGGDEPVEDDHGNTFAGATSIAIPSTVEGDIEVAGDLDYFSLEISERSVLTVETTGNTDTQGTIFDGNQDQLLSDDDGGAGTNFKIERALDAGTYYLEVRGYRDRTGTYTLNASFVADDGSGSGAGDGSTYGVNDSIDSLPLRAWIPDRIAGGSSEINDGVVTIELDDGGLFEEGEYRYTCDHAGGCRIHNRIVERGTIIEKVGRTKLYWTRNGSWRSDAIRRANLDGSAAEYLITAALSFFDGIALDVAAGKMYWVDRDTDKIQRANLDGTEVEDLVTTGLSSPHGIALDVVAGKMYWSDLGTNKIQRANLDGSAVVDLIATGLSSPDGIALDVAAGKMYWVDRGTDKIQRANMDGSAVQDLIATGLDGLSGIALDVAAGKMYWTDAVTDKIQRANMDGTEVEDLVTTGLSFPNGIALDVAAGKMYWTDTAAEKIQRANLDGTTVEHVRYAIVPHGIAIGF